MAIKPSILSNSYVKFVRTNFELWNALQNRDGDTLYFVVDQGSSNGSLYLGDVLIATSIDEGLSLENLLDVAFAGDVQADQVLVYDGANWINQDIYSFMPGTMIGASAEEDGQGGLVPVPVTGEQGLFLRGDGKWANPTAELEVTVGNLSKALDSVGADLETVIGADTGKTMREVASDVTNTAITALVNDAPEAFNTLKEIADWITGDHEGSMDAADLITSVTNLENIVSAETTGLVTRVGALEQAKEALVQSVNDITDILGDETHGLIKDVADNTANIEENANEIVELWKQLSWNVLVDETENV